MPGDRVITVQADVAAAFTGTRDLLIVFTKGPHTEVAVRAATHLAGPATRVLTVQNGLGNAELIAGLLPAARILVGMTSWPADLAGPGHVASHGHGEIRFWTANGDDDAMVPAVAGALSEAGLNAIADPAVAVAIWEKIAFNAAMNSVSAVSRLAVGPIGDSTAGQSLVASIVEEAAAVAHAQGVAVQLERIKTAVAKAFAGHRAHKPSMLQDILAGRRTEIEADQRRDRARRGGGRRPDASHPNAGRTGKADGSKPTHSDYFIGLGRSEAWF